MLNKELITILFTIIGLFSSIDGGVCPQQEIISPCFCEKNDRITCNGSEALNLTQVFKNLSLHLADGQKSFKLFNLSNTAIKELEDNTFRDITFEEIMIWNATDLERIAANAFSAPNTYSIQSFVQYYSSKLFVDESSVKQTFAAFSSLLNVTYVYLDHTLLKSIPNYAFDHLNGFQNNLTLIDFSGYKTYKTITSVENNAFYYVNNLKSLYLAYNRINKISAHSFDFYRESNERLVIDLNDNQIADNSIEVGAFTNSKRQLTIYLRNNLLTYLDELIFANIFKLNKQNKIELYGNPLECDCRMYWLVRDRQLFANQTDDFNCKNGKSLSSLTSADFTNCKT